MNDQCIWGLSQVLGLSVEAEVGFETFLDFTWNLKLKAGVHFINLFIHYSNPLEVAIWTIHYLLTQFYIVFTSLDVCSYRLFFGNVTQRNYKSISIKINFNKRNPYQFRTYNKE